MSEPVVRKQEDPSKLPQTEYIAQNPPISANAQPQQEDKYKEEAFRIFPQQNLKIKKAISFTISKRNKEFQIKEQKLKARIFIFILFGVLAIVCIALEIIINDTLAKFEKDASIIQSLQKIFFNPNNKVFVAIINLSYWIETPHLITCILTFFFFSANPYIGIKLILAYVIDAYCLSNIMTLIFKEGRPFWGDNSINSINCIVSVAGPSMPTTNILTILCYFIYQGMHYDMFKNIPKYLKVLSLVVSVILILYIAFLQILDGSYYLYQEIMAIPLCFLFTFLLLTLDFFISNSAKCVFNIRKVRKTKFITLLYTLVFICLAYIANSGIKSSYIETPDNPKVNNLFCKLHISFSKSFQATTMDCFIIFFYCFVVMGFSSANESIPFYWWKTSMPKRLLRGLLASVTMGLIYFTLYCKCVTSDHSKLQRHEHRHVLLSVFYRAVHDWAHNSV